MREALPVPATKYVKPGGIVVTDDHHGDAIQATVLGDLQLAAVAEKRGQKIFLFDTDLAGYLEPVSHSQRRHSRNVSMSYIRKADYYVFRKLRDNGIGSAHKLR
jgi:hypothetical protein